MLLFITCLLTLKENYYANYLTGAWISSFGPCISQGRIFGLIVRSWKVDLYMGKYGIYLTGTRLQWRLKWENACIIKNEVTVICIWKDSSHYPQLQVSSSSIPGIWIWPVLRRNLSLINKSLLVFNKGDMLRRVTKLKGGNNSKICVERSSQGCAQSLVLCSCTVIMHKLDNQNVSVGLIIRLSEINTVCVFY